MDHAISDLHVLIFHSFAHFFFFLGYAVLCCDYLASFKAVSHQLLLFEKELFWLSLLFFYTSLT